MTTLEQAEATLADLQKHKHAAATANFRMHRAKTLFHMHHDDEISQAKYKAEVDKHTAQKAEALKAHADSGVTDRDIDRAAQAVLDARGESHTETATLHHKAA